MNFEATTQVPERPTEVGSTRSSTPQQLFKAVENLAGSREVRAARGPRDSPTSLSVGNFAERRSHVPSHSESLSFLIMPSWRTAGGRERATAPTQPPWCLAGCGHVTQPPEQHGVHARLRFCFSPSAGEPRCHSLCHRCLGRTSPFGRELSWAKRGLCPHHTSQVLPFEPRPLPNGRST